MAGNMNKSVVVGFLGKDPEVRFTATGKAVANLSVATNDHWTDKDGEKHERTEWHRVVVWGKEDLLKDLKKGQEVYVEGRLETKSWTDKEGMTRYTTELVASEVQRATDGLKKELDETLGRIPNRAKGNPRSVTLLIGQLGKDPEIRATKDGKFVANFSIGTNEYWKDKSSGEEKKKTEWHRVVLWGKEDALKELKKGQAVFVQGEAQTREWENKAGQKQYSTEVLARSVKRLERLPKDLGEMSSEQRAQHELVSTLWKTVGELPGRKLEAKPVEKEPKPVEKTQDEPPAKKVKAAKRPRKAKETDSVEHSA